MGVAAGEVAARGADVRHEQRVADQNLFAIDQVGHVRRGMAGDVQGGGLEVVGTVVLGDGGAAGRERCGLDRRAGLQPGCAAGVFTAPILLPLLAELFDNKEAKRLRKSLRRIARQLGDQAETDNEAETLADDEADDAE